MARFSFSDDIYNMFDDLISKSNDAINKALYEGAGIVADEVRKNLNALPTEKWHHVENGEKIKLSSRDKTEMADHFGIARYSVEAGVHQTHIGFSGYTQMKTKKYPNGIPIQMLARSIESGTSFRQRQPFVRSAVYKVRMQVAEAMAKKFAEALKK